MSPHRIRLPAPWNVAVESNLGRVRFQRSFQRPSGLDHHSRVVLEMHWIDPVFAVECRSITGSEASIADGLRSAFEPSTFTVRLNGNALPSHVGAASTVSADDPGSATCHDAPIDSRLLLATNHLEIEIVLSGVTSASAEQPLGDPTALDAIPPRLGEHYLKSVMLRIE